MAVALKLPQSVLDKAELPMTEELIVAALEDGLPEIPVFSLIPEDPPEHFIVVRKAHPFGPPDQTWTDIMWTRFIIHCFAVDPNGDEEGAILSEAVRVTLREAWRKNLHVPGKGWINHIRLISEGTRVADWSTSAGPVQYADLPNGWWRYESTYELKARREPLASRIV